jgi:hypothetical protein
MNVLSPKSLKWENQADGVAQALKHQLYNREALSSNPSTRPPTIKGQNQSQQVFINTYQIRLHLVQQACKNIQFLHIFSKTLNKKLTFQNKKLVE